MAYGGADPGNSGSGGGNLHRGLFNPQPLRSSAAGAYPQVPPEPDPAPAPYLQALGAVPPNMIGPPGQVPVGGLGPASQPNQMFEAQGVPDIQGLPPELLMQLMQAYGIV